MQKLLLISIFCVYLCSCVSGLPAQQDITVKDCGKSKVPFNVDWDSPDRILGGDHAKPGQFPWIISFYEDGRHVCGGTILNERWIVTAAHCPDWPNSPRRYHIYAGLHKQSEKWRSFVQRLEIEKIVPHEDYDRQTSYHDIALVKVSEPLDISGSGGHINGACLPETSEEATGKAIVSGWGHEWRRGYNSDTLKAVSISIADRGYCTSKYITLINGHPVTEDQLCAGDEGKDSCQNDSGGPLIQADEDGRAVLLGVVSNGYGCGVKGWPGIYTRAYSYIPWMRKVMAKY